MRKPTELSGLLYGGGALMGVGAACIYPPAGLVTLGAWFCCLGLFYIKVQGRPQ